MTLKTTLKNLVCLFFLRLFRVNKRVDLVIVSIYVIIIYKNFFLMNYK